MCIRDSPKGGTLSAAPETKANSPFRGLGGGGITFFNRQIKNWIYWTPAEGKAFWTPQNLTKVWSRGLEVRGNWGWQIKQLQLKIAGGYDWILSTNQVALTTPNIAEGEQLFYVPKHRLFGKLEANFTGFQFIYGHQYTSQVRTPNANLLDDYQLGNASINYAFQKAWFAGRVFFNTNNLWNSNYQIIEHRPMPGTNYEIGLRLKFLKT